MKKNIPVIFAVIMVVLLLSAPLAFSQGNGTSVEGAGIILGVRNNQIVIFGLFQGSPAQRAGVQIGDVLEEYYCYNSFREAKPWDWYSIERQLNPSAGQDVKVKVKRGGQLKEYSFKSTVIPITYSSAPRSEIREGTVREDTGTSRGKSSFTTSSGVAMRDVFMVFDGTQYIGTATLGDVKPDGADFHFSPLEGSKRDVKLSGCKLVFFRPAPGRFNKIKKPVSNRVSPLYKQYWKGVVKKEYKILTGARITSINKATGSLSVTSRRASAAPPSGPPGTYKVWARVYTVNMDFNLARGKTKYLPSNALRELKEGDKVDVFYKEEQGQKRAYLVVISD